MVFRLLVCAMLLFLPARAPAEEFIAAPAAIGISSTVSDGSLSPEEIAAVAREAGFDVLLLTDMHLMRWEYGVWPLRNLLRKAVEEKSVLKYGVGRYLAGLQDLSRKFPGLVVLPAVEAAPFYWWEGSPWQGDLRLNDWHKHLLAVGMENARDYELLPVIGGKGFVRPFRPVDLLGLWPLILSAAGLFTLITNRGGLVKRFTQKTPAVGMLLILGGLLLAVQNVSRARLLFDPYRGSAGITPYQRFIDYVDSRGGLTFWPHPEAANDSYWWGARTVTPVYENDLLRVDRHAGFAVFYAGYDRLGLPGGLWDEQLLQYCSGVRQRPVWAIGALGYESGGRLQDHLRELRTILLVREINGKEALAAMREGRMYVVQGADSSRFVLEEFSVTDLSTGERATMGGELRPAGKPLVRIKGDFSGGQARLVNLQLLYNGKTAARYDVTSPFSVEFEEKEAGPGQKGYYRLEARSEGVHLISNPVFLKRQK